MNRMFRVVSSSAQGDLQVVILQEAHESGTMHIKFFPAWFSFHLQGKKDVEFIFQVIEPKQVEESKDTPLLIKIPSQRGDILELALYKGGDGKIFNASIVLSKIEITQVELLPENAIFTCKRYLVKFPAITSHPL